MQNKNNPYLLITGEVDLQMVNYLSALVNPPFMDSILGNTGGNLSLLQQMYRVFVDMYNDGLESELLCILGPLYEIVDITFPGEVKRVCQNSKCEKYFYRNFYLTFMKA